VGFKLTTLVVIGTDCAVSCKTNNYNIIQDYVIEFVSDLQQVDGFLRVLQFLPPIITDCHGINEIFLKVVISFNK
jgi:hypothetical protein